jgi:hypothetical protein
LLQSLRSFRGTAIKRAAPWHGVSDMEAPVLAGYFESAIPKFRELWEIEDIHREEDRSFSSYSLMAFFCDFVLFKYPEISSKELNHVAKAIEKVFVEDLESHWSDGPTLKDAVIVNFLAVGPKPSDGGLSLEEYLGPISKSHWGRCP